MYCIVALVLAKSTSTVPSLLTYVKSGMGAELTPGLVNSSK